MFDTFSERSIQIIMFAEQEMRRTGHYKIAVPHLFLGMIAQGDNLAASIIASAGVSLEEIRAVVDLSLGKAEKCFRKGIHLEQNANSIIKFAEEIAYYGKAKFVQQEHVFTSMLLLEGSSIILWCRGAGIDVADADALALQTMLYFF